MVQFYFNSCFSNVCCKNIQNVFATLMYNYSILYKQYQECVSRGVITVDYPSNLFIGDESLQNLSVKLSDDALRRFTLGQFSKYPIDKYIPKSTWEDDGYCEYTFENTDAYDLFYASKMEWFLLTLPLNDMCKNNYLKLTPIDINQSYIEIINYFGNNSDFIYGQIEKSPYYKINNIDYLKTKIFTNYKCICSKEFEEQYEKCQLDFQKYINDRFKIAVDKNIICQSVRPDNQTVKECKGNDLNDLYELRSKNWDGMRVYFSLLDNDIYIGMLSTKAKSDGKEQTADMLKAKHIIGILYQQSHRM